MKLSYGYVRETGHGVDEAIERVTNSLAEQGFGVLTTIDVKTTLKKKLDLDVRPYVILGACNPRFAHQALSAEPGVGLLLPCNVVVFEDESGKTVVAAIDAREMLGVVGRDDLGPVADAVNAGLRAAVDAV